MILPRNRLQSLHLTSCIDIKCLQKVKHCTQWYHYGNKIDVGITYDNDCAQNTKKLADQASEDGWYGYINDVNILEESNFFFTNFSPDPTTNSETTNPEYSCIIHQSDCL